MMYTKNMGTKTLKEFLWDYSLGFDVIYSSYALWC